MDDVAVLSELGRAMGSAARARMLLALADGDSHNASDLALTAEVSAATASSHLARLEKARLVRVETKGRERLYRLRDASVAGTVEQLLALRGNDGRPGERSLMRLARSCYDHLAGLVAVGVAEAMLERGYVRECGSDFELSASGEEFLSVVGVDVSGARAKKRLFARQCLDWTEQRPHIAGALGAAILERALAAHWFERMPGSRALVLTEGGAAALRWHFGLDAGLLALSPMPRRSGRGSGRLMHRAPNTKTAREYDDDDES